MLKQISIGFYEIYQRDFLKVVVWDRVMKGGMTGFFVEHPVYSLLSAESQQKWNG